jgi:hypothetical protein
MSLCLKNHNSRPYGTACCVNCEADIDLSGQLNSIAVRFGNEILYYCICDKCQFQHTSREQYKKTASKAFEKTRAVSPEHSCFAVLSHVALYLNDNDPVAAFEIGQTLPFHIYESILQGRTKLAKIGGMVLIDTDEA